MRTPKYRIRTDCNRAFVCIGGKRITLPGAAKSPESKRAYYSIVAEHLRGQAGRAGVAGSARPRRQPTAALQVADIVVAWLDHCKVYYGATSNTRSNEYDNCKYAVRPLVALFGDMLVADFGPDELKAVRAAMVSGNWSTPNAKKPIVAWPRSHANAQINRIKRCWKWGVEHGMVEPAAEAILRVVAPLRRNPTVAAESEPVGPVDAAVVDATLPHMPPTVADMVRVQRLTGLRSDNVCSLRPCDLDRTGDVWVYQPAAHKGSHRGKSLAVAVGPKAQAVLLPYLSRSATVFVFNSNRNPASRYSPNTYRNAITRAIKRANAARASQPSPLDPLPHWHPHQLRHTRGTEVRAHAGAEAARASLGHLHLRTTELYAEADLSTAKEIARRIG